MKILETLLKSTKTHNNCRKQNYHDEKARKALKNKEKSLNNLKSIRKEKKTR